MKLELRRKSKINLRIFIKESWYFKERIRGFYFKIKSKTSKWNWYSNK